MKLLRFVIQNFILMLIMGTVYTWSVFRVSVEEVFSVGALASGFPYMVSLFFYALSMMISGWLTTPKNTRKLALIGTLMIALGWGISAWASALWVLVVGYGVIMGYGVGLVYGVPVYILNKTSPKSGFHTGIVLAGFGASPLVTAPMVGLFLNATNLTSTFLLMSVIALVVLVPMTWNLRLDARYIQQKNEIVNTLHLGRFSVFYLLFMLATTIGLMMIGLSYRMGVVNYGFAETQMVIAVSIFAFFNGLARPIFGWLMDRYAFIWVASLSLLLLVFASVISFINIGQSVFLFGVSMGLYWFNLGAWLAIIPALVKQAFGTYRFAQRYGTLFTAYGLGAIIGTLLSGFVLDVFPTTRLLYALVFSLVIFMAVLVVVQHQIHQKSSQAS